VISAFVGGERAWSTCSRLFIRSLYPRRSVPISTKLASCLSLKCVSSPPIQHSRTLQRRLSEGSPPPLEGGLEPQRTLLPRSPNCSARCVTDLCRNFDFGATNRTCDSGEIQVRPGLLLDHMMLWVQRDFLAIHALFLLPVA